MSTDDGLFGPRSLTWRVNVEPVMWIAGLRALHLQSLDPKVMRGTYQNSALFDRRKAWERFLRTAQYVTVRTYGTHAEAHTAAARVRRIHARLTGFDPDTGTRFRLDEPEGLAWVHNCEIDSYVDVARRAGVLSAADADRYIRENTAAAALVGLDPHTVPATTREMTEYFHRSRPRLRATPEALRALMQSFHPPLPRHLAPARVLVPAVTTLALATLPAWARRKLGIPVLPGSDAVTTVQLRAIRAATTVAGADTTDRIAQARRSAHEMAAGTFTSILSTRPRRSPRPPTSPAACTTGT
ncbi:uncharacterized protein (DUF2236 family) [Stackebrandtia albiflava]|uniref:Uncharacterized protein (DUF2236 family) n=1 Tax=Stackebrandtia albiflava TaxID=406432 RepID=A0A562VDK3_9ACTN|nr:oxygenase MpaB family protein [Stackebrandtia albiflava]TWJ15942.1 uncharacterized protein (DUF2236 family) [Stackebrandtia albiflava]